MRTSNLWNISFKKLTATDAETGKETWESLRVDVEGETMQSAILNLETCHCELDEGVLQLITCCRINENILIGENK